MSERVYWRSADPDPEFTDREFLPGADEPPEGISRRTMLQLLGASVSLAGLAGCRKPVEAIVPYVDPPEHVIPGVPRRYATTIPLGGQAYGVIVESHEGRPTKIEGNPRHPSTLGASSVWLQAQILDLYDPDRSQTVLHTEEKQAEPKTWADFVAAWGEIAKAASANGGADLALLIEPFASPTLARLLAQFQAAFPQAKVVVWDPSGEEGSQARPVYHLDKATTIVAFDADLFYSHGNPVVQARQFADGRRLGTPAGEMNRLYVVESAYSITGAKADHRFAVAPSQIPAVLRALRNAVKGGGAADPTWVGALAKDLSAHRGESLVVAGGRWGALTPVVDEINAALGNLGQTITHHEARDAGVSSTWDFHRLIEAMRAGSVKTLVVMGGNPVYATPADLAFGEALKKVPQTIHVGSHVDETAGACSWHVPQAHALESWGDCRGADGTLSVMQPLILPLFGGKTSVEVLTLLATGQDRPGYDVVRETWATLLPADGFEKAWRTVLHDGMLADSALPALAPAVLDLSEVPAFKAAQPAQGGGLELLFRLSPAVHDGRYANLSWLQELPDSISKITWDNPLLMSPKTAQDLGVENEDVVEVEVGGKKVRLPVWIVPGTADGTLVATLGYGRTAAGRVGNDVGISVYPLWSSQLLWENPANKVQLGQPKPGFLPGVKVSKTGDTYTLASTQDHGTMEGRPVVREATLEEYRKEPHFASEMVEVPEVVPLYGSPNKYDAGHQWGMAIDLTACVGCNACTIACQSENNIPVVGKAQVLKGREMHWIRVDRYFSGVHKADAQPRVVFQPVPCMQCENAPCESVCPVAATVHDHEGLNAMVYNRCIGTRYCSNNCPYKVRRFNYFNFTKDTPEILKMANNPDVTVRSRGVMEKCTYCVQRLNRAKIDAKFAGRPLADGDVETACQQACPAEAISFGDLRDGNSRVVAAKKSDRNYALLAELNTRTRTTYLAGIRNPNPELA
ncbi:MAG TPA: 4Fe-4S dicluster domain-containing protein [Candidatus Polarisedimenticolaceae bacterium]|nr:4Fe-4S dicluster domain-containing protein [Candidatus Polarisedimenticolaceae bacterium]